MVEPEGREDDQIEDTDPAALQTERVAGALLAEPPAEHEQHERAGGYSGEPQLDRQIEALARVLEQERDAEEQHHDADPHDRVAAREPAPDGPLLQHRSEWRLVSWR